MASVLPLTYPVALTSSRQSNAFKIVDFIAARVNPLPVSAAAFVLQAILTILEHSSDKLAFFSSLKAKSSSGSCTFKFFNSVAFNSNSLIYFASDMSSERLKISKSSKAENNC